MPTEMCDGRKSSFFAIPTAAMAWSPWLAMRLLSTLLEMAENSITKADGRPTDMISLAIDQFTSASLILNESTVLERLRHMTNPK